MSNYDEEEARRTAAQEAQLVSLPIPAKQVDVLIVNLYNSLLHHRALLDRPNTGRKRITELYELAVTLISLPLGDLVKSVSFEEFVRVTVEIGGILQGSDQVEALASAYENYIVMSCEPGDARSYMQDVVNAAANLIRSMPALVQAHGGPLAEHFKNRPTTNG